MIAGDGYGQTNCTCASRVPSPFGLHLIQLPCFDFTLFVTQTNNKHHNNNTNTRSSISNSPRPIVTSAKPRFSPKSNRIADHSPPLHCHLIHPSVTFFTAPFAGPDRHTAPCLIQPSQLLVRIINTAQQPVALLRPSFWHWGSWPEPHPRLRTSDSPSSHPPPTRPALSTGPVSLIKAPPPVLQTRREPNFGPHPSRKREREEKISSLPGRYAVEQYRQSYSSPRRLPHTPIIRPFRLYRCRARPDPFPSHRLKTGHSSSRGSGPSVMAARHLDSLVGGTATPTCGYESPTEENQPAFFFTPSPAASGTVTPVRISASASVSASVSSPALASVMSPALRPPFPSRPSYNIITSGNQSLSFSTPFDRPSLNDVVEKAGEASPTRRVGIRDRIACYQWTYFTMVRRRECDNFNHKLVLILLW